MKVMRVRRPARAVGLIGVRWHAFVGAALLALAVPLAMLAALRLTPLPRDLHLTAILGGLTLFAQATAFWYLPSFTKRAVALDGLAAYSGPLLLPAGIVGALLGFLAFRASLPSIAVGIFGIILLATPLAGARWRSGIPFWRTPGPHQPGDRAAMVALAAAAIALLAAGVVGLFAPPLLAWAWPASLGAFALGALGHLVPRARGRPLLVTPFLTGVACYHSGAILIFATRSGRSFGDSFLGEALLAGAALALAAMLGPGSAKAAGPRWREARIPLLLAFPTLALALGFSLAGRSLGLTFSAYYAHLAVVALLLAALVHLTFPVVFNRPPARAFVLPAALAATGGALLLAIGFLTTLPRWPGAALLAAALLLWLAALAPLRRPRRDCPPGGPEAS